MFNHSKRLALASLCLLIVATGTEAADLLAPVLDPTGKVKAEVGTVNGKNVLRYTWKDSAGRPRSASLVCQNAAGTNCGGYAWQFTYQADDASSVVVNAAAGGDSGFGYFVSHELYRNFSNGTSGAIAHRHGQDDSPLSKGFAGTGVAVSADMVKAVHQFTLNYPHWGTVSALANDATVSIDPATHQKYDIPVKITWEFINGADYPLWSAEYDFSAVPVNTVYVDIRGPYGNMRFDNDGDSLVTGLEWGDKYLFTAQADAAGGITSNSAWQWDTLNNGARYNLLIAGPYEMGIVENKPYKDSTLGSGWSDNRGRNSTQVLGCAPDVMPCDWQWAYQSIQYGLMSDVTSNKKLAWGTAPFVGSDLTAVYVNNTETDAFSGYPKVAFSVWITFDKSTGVKTRSLAAAGGQLPRPVSLPSPKVAYTLDNGHVYVSGTKPGSATVDISAATEALATQPGRDDRINVSPNGKWLIFNSERFNSECDGLSCLVVMPSSLANASIITSKNGVIARTGGDASAISSTGRLVVFAQASATGAHAVDLWAVRQLADKSWGNPLKLTGNSPYQSNSMPALSADGSKLVFECGDDPLGTALCEVSTTGKNFHIVLQPDGAALHHPDYAPDGSIVFQVGMSDGDSQLWRLPIETNAPVLINGQFHHDHSPCVLPSGQIISLWPDRQDNAEGQNEIKLMNSNGRGSRMIGTGIDVLDVGIGCGQ